MVCLDHADVSRNRTAQLSRFGLCDILVLTLPERQQQCHYRILLLHVEDVIIRIERIERNRMFLGVGVVYAILSVCLTVDHGTQSRIRVSRVNQHDVGTLLIVLAHDVVHEETLSAARRPKHELVSIRRDTLLHRQITNVDVQRLPRQPVHHLDAKGRERRSVVGLFRKQAHRRLDERIERFFRREIGFVAGNA